MHVREGGGGDGGDSSGSNGGDGNGTTGGGGSSSSFSNPSTIKSSSDKETTIFQWTTVGLGALLAYCCESQFETPFLRGSFVGLILLPQALHTCYSVARRERRASLLLGIRCVTLVCHAI